MTAEVDLVIRGGRVVNAGWSGQADVLIGSGRVVGVVEPGTMPAGAGNPNVVDAGGKLVLPGGVDPHCHVGFTSGDFTSLDDFVIEVATMRASQSADPGAIPAAEALN